MKACFSYHLLAAAALTGAQSISSSAGISSVTTTAPATPTVTPGPTLIHPNFAQSSHLDDIFTQVILGTFSGSLSSFISAVENLPQSALEQIEADATYDPSPENWGAWGATPLATQLSWESVLPGQLHHDLDVLASNINTALFAAVQTPLNSIYASEYGPNASPPWPTKGPLLIPPVPAYQGSGVDLRPVSMAAVAAAVGFAAFLM